MFRRLASVVLLSIAFTATSFAADGKPHRIAIQVDQNDPQVMNLALNNATNVIEYYRARNEDVDVDIVTYGPGLHMLRADTSPSRAWRRPKATPSPLCLTPPSFPRASSA